MKPKIALCLIVKGDEDPKLLDRCLSSVNKHIDGIFLNINAPKGKKPSKELLKTARKFTDDIIETEWTGNFVKSRTENFNQVPDSYEWIMWLDVDDEVKNPEKIAEVCAIASEEVNGIYINYEYAHDEYGNVTVQHYNARVVRNNGTFKWQSSFEDGEITVHETLNEVRKTGKVMNDEWCVIHKSTDERMDESLARNIKLLEAMLDKEQLPDPRILFYLATHYVDAGLLARAKTLFEQYLKLSGWAEERAQAWGYLGDIYRRMKQPDTARGCYMRAMAENPKDPSSYVELGELELNDGLNEKAIEWLETATKKKTNLTATISRPMESTYRAYKLLTQAYTNLGVKGHEKASKYLEKALKLRPFDPELQEARKTLDELRKITKLNESVLDLVKELKIKEKDKISGLVDHLPLQLQDSPLVTSIRNFYKEPKKWPKKSIAIVCGSSALGSWGPWSLEQGIGGSEEAVIQLSKLLKDMGWKIEVFATPGTKAGEYDGVKWSHYWEFTSRDEFDIVIGWRDPSLFDKKLNARKSYLWLHDVVDRNELTPERLKNLTKVIFVSQYHRDIYDFIKDDKCFVSGNGIDPEQFNAKATKRNQYKCIYMSAHERGLELLYSIWADVRKEVPQATLDVYYGWTGFDVINRDNPERMGWKQRLLNKEKQLESQGVTNHGKIGHKEIVEKINEAGIWTYPTPFPEVYCISGVKAQAGGAWPVVSDYAALKETVQFGEKIPMPKYAERTRAGNWNEKDLEKYKKALIKTLKNPPTDKQRQEMINWAKSNMSWSVVSKSWNKELE